MTPPYLGIVGTLSLTTSADQQYNMSTQYEVCVLARALFSTLLSPFTPPTFPSNSYFTPNTIHFTQTTRHCNTIRIRILVFQLENLSNSKQESFSTIFCLFFFFKRLNSHNNKLFFQKIT